MHHNAAAGWGHQNVPVFGGPCDGAWLCFEPGQAVPKTPRLRNVQHLTHELIVSGHRVRVVVAVGYPMPTQAEVERAFADYGRV